MYINKLKEMFSEMVQKKDASLIPFYYHQEFVLYANEQVQDYGLFAKLHEEYYATKRQYKVEYDETTFLEQGDKVAARVWITVTLPDELPKKLEVILIAQYKEDKIYRLWELAYPDWSKMSGFGEIAS